MDFGQTLQILAAIFTIAGVLLGVAGSIVSDKGYRETFQQVVAQIKDSRKRGRPSWTPYVKVQTKNLPPFEGQYYVELDCKMWSEDNNVPLMLRIAPEANYGFSNTITGPSVICKQLLSEKQIFYVSASSPDLEYEIYLKSWRDPFIETWTELANPLLLYRKAKRPLSQPVAEKGIKRFHQRREGN